MMSAPFAGPPVLPFGAAEGRSNASTASPKFLADLAALDRPRKHYHWYYSTREANDNMRNARYGLHAFLRAYYHHKSADWKQNQPFRLKAWSAEELANLPTYYIMDLHKGMAETVAAEMPSASEIAACQWLTEDELRVYSAEFARTGFQGGLQWYRAGRPGNRTPTWSSSPAARSTCRHALSRAPATGVSIRSRAILSRCRQALHADGGLPSCPWRRALGAARAARAGDQATVAFCPRAGSRARTQLIQRAFSK